MMELSENVSYMKLLHELKGDFPNMADDYIHQCIKQVRTFESIIWHVYSNLANFDWHSYSYEYYEFA